MRLIREHSDYPFISARWTPPPAKLIHQIFLAMVVVVIEDFSCGYLGEPEYTEQQAKSIKFRASSSSSDDDELNSSRLENLHWCTCHHCTVMPTFIECKYCEEFPDLLKDKLDDACIRDHKDFDVLYLHNSVLETAFIRHRRYKNNYNDAKEMTLKYAVVN